MFIGQENSSTNIIRSNRKMPFKFTYIKNWYERAYVVDVLQNGKH